MSPHLTHSYLLSIIVLFLFLHVTYTAWSTSTFGSLFVTGHNLFRVRAEIPLSCCRCVYQYADRGEREQANVPVFYADHKRDTAITEHFTGKYKIFWHSHRWNWRGKSLLLQVPQCVHQWWPRCTFCHVAYLSTPTIIIIIIIIKSHSYPYCDSLTM